MPLWPASAVGGLTSVDLTLHVTTANLETLAAISYASMLASSKIERWLSGISQSKEGVVLHSDSTPTFSLMAPSTYMPTYSMPDTWDMPPPSPTVVSDFPDTVPAHPFDNLPHLTPEPVSLDSLMQPWPYNMHHFSFFRPY